MKCCGTSSHAAYFQRGSVLLTLNRAVKAGVKFHCETSLCFSTANIDLLPITASVVGFQRSHAGFPALLSRVFPGSIQVWSRPALHRLAHPAGPSVCGGILFQPGKTGKHQRGGFLPIPSMGWVSTAASLLKLLDTHQIISLKTAYLVIPATVSSNQAI